MPTCRSNAWHRSRGFLNWAHVETSVQIVHMWRHLYSFVLIADTSCSMSLFLDLPLTRLLTLASCCHTRYTPWSVCGLHRQWWLLKISYNWSSFWMCRFHDEINYLSIVVVHFSLGERTLWAKMCADSTLCMWSLTIQCLIGIPSAVAGAGISGDSRTFQGVEFHMIQMNNVFAVVTIVESFYARRSPDFGTTRRDLAASTVPRALRSIAGKYVTS